MESESLHWTAVGWGAHLSVGVTSVLSRNDPREGSSRRRRVGGGRSPSFEGGVRFLGKRRLPPESVDVYGGTSPWPSDHTVSKGSF